MFFALPFTFGKYTFHSVSFRSIPVFFFLPNTLCLQSTLDALVHSAISCQFVCWSLDILKQSVFARAMAGAHWKCVFGFDFSLSFFIFAQKLHQCEQRKEINKTKRKVKSKMQKTQNTANECLLLVFVFIFAAVTPHSAGGIHFWQHTFRFALYLQCNYV